MTKQQLLDTISKNVTGYIDFNAILTAVESYSAASNGAKPLVSGSLPPVQERDEDDLYCLNCGTTKLTYVEQYANGECWECRDCDWRTYRQGGNDC